MLKSSVHKESPFQQWLRAKWIEHLEELDAWNMPRPQYGPDKYFQMYKWWLKREYRFQKSRQQS